MPQSQRLRNFDPAVLDPAGNPRPALPDVEPVFHSGPHGMNELPQKISTQMALNEKAKPCCRVMGNLRANLFRSPTAGGKPDIMVATCICGRRHYRVAVNPIGNTEKRSVL